MRKSTILLTVIFMAVVSDLLSKFYLKEVTHNEVQNCVLIIGYFIVKQLEENNESKK